MKNPLVLIAFLVSGSCFSQNDWSLWEKNYLEFDAMRLLEIERNYADSIEFLGDSLQYYSRLHKYKIKATYLGEKKRLDSKVLSSMKRVFKLFGGDSDQIADIVKNETLFKVGNSKIWMPTQKILEKPMKKEVSIGQEIILYCLFLNEHNSQNELFSTFLISEFRVN